MKERIEIVDETKQVLTIDPNVKFSMGDNAREVIYLGYRWEVLVFQGGVLYMTPVRFSREDDMREFITSLGGTLKLIQNKTFSIHISEWQLKKEPGINIIGRD